MPLERFLNSLHSLPRVAFGKSEPSGAALGEPAIIVTSVRSQELSLLNAL